MDLLNRKILYRIAPVSLLFQSLMVFYSLLPPFIVAILCLLIFMFYYRILRNYFSFPNALFLISILYIPTSTISILGGDYTNLPLTWFNFLHICLFLLSIVNEKVDRTYFLLMMLFVIVCLYTLVVSLDVLDSMKQILITFLFLMSFILGKVLKKESSSFFIELGWFFYLLSVISVALQILLQYIYINVTGNVIGHYGKLGINRILYAGLMGDFSFASLFLATGICYVLIIYLKTKKINTIFFLTIESLLSIATILITSRTGIVSLVIVMSLFFLDIRNWTLKYLLVLLGVFSGSFIIVEKLLSSRLGQSFLDSSGRVGNYIEAFDLFFKRSFFGYGMGRDTILKLENFHLPHNFFIQYLVQIGFIGLIVILLFFSYFIMGELKYARSGKWVFWIIMIGSMFVPDIVTSRFLTCVVILCMIEGQNNMLNERRLCNEKSRKISTKGL